MLIGLILQLISANDCSFATAFEKGREDIEAGSYGANIDRFCSYASDDDRRNFPKAYELGRIHGPTLKKAELHQIPTDTTELSALLKEAKLSMASKEIMERISTTPAKPSDKPDNQEIQNLTKRIESLEAENRKLTEQVHVIPEQK